MLPATPKKRGFLKRLGNATKRKLARVFGKATRKRSSKATQIVSEAKEPFKKGFGPLASREGTKVYSIYELLDMKYYLLVNNGQQMIVFRKTTRGPEEKREYHSVSGYLEIAEAHIRNEICQEGREYTDPLFVNEVNYYADLIESMLQLQEHEGENSESGETINLREGLLRGGIQSVVKQCNNLIAGYMAYTEHKNDPDARKQAMAGSKLIKKHGMLNTAIHFARKIRNTAVSAYRGMASAMTRKRASGARSKSNWTHNPEYTP